MILKHSNGWNYIRWNLTINNMLWMVYFMNNTLKPLRIYDTTLYIGWGSIVYCKRQTAQQCTGKLMTTTHRWNSKSPIRRGKTAPRWITSKQQTGRQDMNVERWWTAKNSEANGIRNDNRNCQTLRDYYFSLLKPTVGDYIGENWRGVEQWQYQ